MPTLEAKRYTPCTPYHTWPAVSASTQVLDTLPHARCECGALTLLEARTRRFVANEVRQRRMGAEARSAAREYDWR